MLSVGPVWTRPELLLGIIEVLVVTKSELFLFLGLSPRFSQAILALTNLGII